LRSFNFGVLVIAQVLFFSLIIATFRVKEFLGPLDAHLHKLLIR
jgi:hypothetical protein